MTQKEFTQRVKVEVSNDEFDAINVVYMNSDLNKDEFCKMWCKMNASRVKEAKAEMKRRAQEEAERNTLFKFYDKTRDESSWWTPITYVPMTCREIEAMCHAGIKFSDNSVGTKWLYDIRFEIGKHLGMF